MKNVWPLVIIFLSVLCLGVSCKKSSPASQSQTYVQAEVNNTKLQTNFCELYSLKNFWIVDGWSYKQDASEPPIYPRLQLWIWKFPFKTGSFTIGVDSVTAYYFPTATDTIPAVYGNIVVNYVYPTLCGGITGTFNITLADSTKLTKGVFITGPSCYLL